MSDKKKKKGKAEEVPADESANKTETETLPDGSEKKAEKKKVEKKLPQVPAGMSHA